MTGQASTQLTQLMQSLSPDARASMISQLQGQFTGQLSHLPQIGAIAHGSLSWSSTWSGVHPQHLALLARDAQRPTAQPEASPRVFGGKDPQTPIRSPETRRPETQSLGEPAQRKPIRLERVFG